MNNFVRTFGLIGWRYYQYAAATFVLLSLGYLLRAQIPAANEAVQLLLGVFPNLLGSFATPFGLLLILYKRLNRPNLLHSLTAFALINLFTFAVCVLIEIAHVVADLGVFDMNDMFASLVGAAAALAAFYATGLAFAPGAAAPAGVKQSGSLSQ